MTYVPWPTDLHTRLLQASPFDASLRGIPGYDAQVPDASPEADQLLRQDAEQVIAAAAALEPTELSFVDRVTLDCIVDTAERTILDIDAALVDLTVTPMPITGPPVLLAVAARTIIGNAAAAADYLERLQAADRWLAQEDERLRVGAAKRPGAGRAAGAAGHRVGRHRVGRWRPAGTSRAPAAAGLGRRGRVATRARGRGSRAGRTGDRALARHARRRAARRSPARDTRPGLVYVPGGEADYERMIRAHTTLPLTADELHQTGLDHIATARRSGAKALGAELGLRRPPRRPRRDARGGRRVRSRGGDGGGGRCDPACRGSCRRGVPGSAAATVRGHADATERRGEWHRAALHPATSRRRQAGNLLVQHDSTDCGWWLGPGGGGLPRGGAGSPSAAVPRAVAHRSSCAATPTHHHRACRRLGAVRRTAG